MSERPHPHIIISAEPGSMRLIPWPTKDGMTLLHLPVIAWEVIPDHAVIPITAWGLPENKESSYVTAPGRPEVFDGAGRWWTNEAAFLTEQIALDAALVRDLARKGLAPVYYPHGGPLGAREFFPSREGGAQ
jgi:hypothetical protein